MSQEDLAQAMSRAGLAFHQSTIYKIESGERRVQLTEAIALAKIFGVSVDQLASSRTDRLSELAALRRAIAERHDERLRIELAILDHEVEIGDLRGLVTVQHDEVDRLHRKLELGDLMRQLTMREKAHLDELLDTKLTKIDRATGVELAIPF